VADRVLSNTSAAKAALISDRQPLIDKKLLFDAVPFFIPFLRLRSGFEARCLNGGEKSKAKGIVNSRKWFRECCLRNPSRSLCLAIHES
jgi:hypothetical protein